MMPRARNTDVFAAANTLLFLLLCAAVYWEQFLRYRGRGNVHEFLIYAGCMLAVIGASWLSLRKVEFRSSLLVLMQIGILAHFAGAFVPLGGGRLYDATILGLGYDKYVHFLNAFAGAAVIAHLFGLRGARSMSPPEPVHPLAILMVVLGAGSVLEILEYSVTLVMPNSGVGGYDNNMRDLVANLAGASAFLLVRALGPRAAAAGARRAEA